MQIAIPPILESKKFKAAALASILSFLGLRYGWGVEGIAAVTAPLYAFIGAQGIADIGKERARAEAAAKPTQPPAS